MYRKILEKIHGEKVDVYAGNIRAASLHAARARQRGGRRRMGEALITWNGKIFISERRTESNRRAQKNKTIDKKNYGMREGTVEIIGGTRARILPSVPRDAGGAKSLVTA